MPQAAAEMIWVRLWGAHTDKQTERLTPQLLSVGVPSCGRASVLQLLTRCVSSTFRTITLNYINLLARASSSSSIKPGDSRVNNNADWELQWKTQNPKQTAEEIQHFPASFYGSSHKCCKMASLKEGTLMCSEQLLTYSEKISLYKGGNFITSKVLIRNP